MVAERIAQPAVDAVRSLGRLLGKLDALRAKFGVGLAAVVGREEQVSAGGPLGQQLADLGRGLLVERRRSRGLQQDLAITIAWDTYGQPAHETEVLVGIDLEAKLADVELERLVLVENIERRNRECVEHLNPPRLREIDRALTLDDVLRQGFSKTARSRPGHREAVGDGLDGPTLAIGARRLADDISKDPAERTQAAEADVEADVGHTSIGCPQQVHGALDPATLEIAVRGLVKGCPKGWEEVRLRYVSHPGEGGDVERLRVGSVHGVAGAQHPSVELLDRSTHP